MSKQTFIFNLPQINLENEVTNPKEMNTQQLIFLLAQKRFQDLFTKTLQTKRFGAFTFKFEEKVEKIVLICELFSYNIELSVTELFDLQKRVKRLGGLAHWITLEIYTNKNAVSYLSFDH